MARTPDRSRLWRAQTPQMFRLGELHAALASAMQRAWLSPMRRPRWNWRATRCNWCPASASNLKVTLPEDPAAGRPGISPATGIHDNDSSRGGVHAHRSRLRCPSFY